MFTAAGWASCWWCGWRRLNLTIARCAVHPPGRGITAARPVRAVVGIVAHPGWVVALDRLCRGISPAGGRRGWCWRCWIALHVPGGAGHDYGIDLAGGAGAGVAAPPD